MVDLNGHEAGNGGYSQGRPTARRVLLYSERCLVIPENEMLAPPGVYLPARSAFLRLAWDRMRTIKVIRSARASRFCACPPSYAKDAPCMLEFPGSRSWLLAAFVQPPGVEITLSPYQTICRSPLSTDRGTGIPACPLTFSFSSKRTDRNVCPTRYSTRSAMIGSTRAARRAGT